jgi:hypothetical protein
VTALLQKAKECIDLAEEARLKPLATFLVDMAGRLPSPNHPLASVVFKTISHALTQIQQSDSARRNLPLLHFIKATWLPCLSALDQDAVQALDKLLRQSIPSFILEQLDLSTAALELFQQYLTSRNDSEATNAAWQALFDVLPAAETDRIWNILNPLVKSAAVGSLPAGLKSAGLDHFLRQQVNDTILRESSPLLPADKAENMTALLVKPGELAGVVRVYI